MEAKAKPAKPALAGEFERLYYAEVDPEELAARTAKDLAGAAAAHLEFGAEFSGGNAKPLAVSRSACKESRRFA